MTRRQFVASTALLTAAQAAPKRNLLTSLWTGTELQTAARGSFHPFPTAAERAGWEQLPADARAALIAAGKRQLHTPWEVLPATAALEFARTGNRSHYQDMRNLRRQKLQDLV